VSLLTAVNLYRSAKFYAKTFELFYDNSKIKALFLNNVKQFGIFRAKILQIAKTTFMHKNLHLAIES